MTPQQQCTNLELSKKLKELGYPQESLFYWHYSYNPTTKQVNEPYLLFNPGITGNELETNISAPTVAELGEMLPAQMTYEGRVFDLTIEKTSSGFWTVQYTIPTATYLLKTERTLQDTLAKMLIYLLENKLIEL